MRRFNRSAQGFIGGLCIVLLFAFSSSLADAGGWAVVTLDTLPREVVAGQVFTVGFTVRQHGRTLLGGLSPKLQAYRSAFETANFTAKAEGALGHYTAAMKLPSAGEWKWKIEAFDNAQPMPVLHVLATTLAPNSVTTKLATVSAPTANTSTPALLALTLLALSPIGGLSALLLWQRKRARWALPLLFASAGVGMLGGWLMTQNATPNIQPIASNTSAKPSAADETVSQMAYGHDLFLAKGCVMCHAHSAFRAEVTQGPFFMGDIEPPDLTKTEFSVEHIRNWLKNPQAIKPNTEMPNLNLKQDEIDALAMFLSAKPSANAPTTTTSLVTNAVTCPVTKPQTPLFTPSAPYTAKAPWADMFWYGTENLWTRLDNDGTWRALPHNAEGYTQKVFWWRKGYDWQAEPTPKLTITGKRLDGNAPPLSASRATNASGSDIGSAMLVGVDVPTLGCWEITGQYGGHTLSFVVKLEP